MVLLVEGRKGDERSISLDSYTSGSSIGTMVVFQSYR